MTNTKKASQSNVKIASALRAMRQRFSNTEFRNWDTKQLVAEFKIGGTFTHALKLLEAVETKRGMVKLAPRFLTLRPSTVRKCMNAYVHTKNESVKKVKVVSPVTKTESTFDEIVIALKAKLKQEVMAELLQSLK
jgi:hypothetical protein